MRLLLLLCSVLFVAACDRAVAPLDEGKGPGCALIKEIPGLVRVTTYHSDCTGFNLDSLRAEGWRVDWY